jgi:hypothetical protein
MSYAELQTAGREGKSWLWEGYLASGNVTLLTSQWKTGKSTLIAVLLGRLKTGGELGGLRLSAGRAVVVSEEPASKWYERGQTLPFGDHLCWYCRPFLGKPRPEDWLDLLDQISRLHDQQRIDLLVIDSFANLAPMRSENEAMEMLKAVLPLQRLTTRGMSVLLSLHPKKGTVQPGQAARGSSALPGYADIIIEMDRISRRNMKDRRRRLQAYSRHEETRGKWIIELTPDGSDYLSLGECAEPSFERGWPVLKRLLEEADGPLTRRELLRQWPDEALPPAKLTLWKWLDQVVKEGQVLREGAGQRKDPYRYRLPGMEEKWHQQSLERLMKLLE